MKKYLIYICAVLAALCAVLTACGVKSTTDTPAQSDSVSYDELRGSWTIDGHTGYYFDGLGSGKMTVSNDVFDFSYTIADSQLTIDFKSETATDSTYGYSFSGDKLVFVSKDANKGSYTLTRADSPQ